MSKVTLINHLTSKS